MIRAIGRSMLARRFLYAIAILILLVILGGIGWSLFQDRLMRLAFVPSVAFTAPADATAPDYAHPAAWLARPGLPGDPTRFTPPGFAATGGPAAIFYVAPTTYLAKDRWNAPLDDGQANYRLGLFAASQASAFNGVGAVWAPRYRQATIGAFLAGDDRATRAIDFAYHDVARAFDAFVAAQPADRPIILAGHSQGSLHLIRLLHDKIAGTPLTARIAAVYAIGWPISRTADLPALGLPGCAAPGQARCIVAWQSFAEPAEPRLIHDYFDRGTGFTGLARKGTRMLCVNPLTGGGGGGAAPASANRGALVPHTDLAGVDIARGLVPARCSPDGLLLIGPPPPGYGRYVLPGNNYHVFDYALFCANLRADAAARLAAFRAR